jgi:[ribosomal protein S5]-alanine N-acetyltransferase
MVVLNLPEQIHTERLRLQRLRYEDAEEIFYTYASKPEATRFMSWPTHLNIGDTRSFLRYAHAAWDSGIDYSFSVRLQEDNRLIGSFGVINEEGKLQFGYIFSPTQWDNGYATEVCIKMMSLLRQQQEVVRIGTYVDVENAASCKVLLKSGLVEEARLKNWMRFPNQDNRPKDCVVFILP